MNISLMIQVLDALVYHTAQTRPIEQTNEAIKALTEALNVMNKKTEQLPYGTLAQYRGNNFHFEFYPGQPYPDNAIDIKSVFTLDQLIAEYNLAIDDAIEMVAFHGGTVHLEANIRQLKK